MTIQKLADDIVDWMRRQVGNANAKGVVLGISGGVDSAVAAGLAKRALGNASLGLIMPCHSAPDDEEHARLVAQTFGIACERIDLGPVFDLLEGILPAGTPMATANLKPRLRMLTLYYFANSRNYLVVGTGNRSELSVGYFTKYGDGGVDILPLGSLLKHEVRSLARELGVPDVVINKAPSGGLWEGQTDEGEMGITYETLDRALQAIETGETDWIAPERLAQVEKMMARSAHKRDPIPVFVPAR